MTSDCAGTATIEDESVAPNSGSEPTFTAVVYFHGMGSQKRYEEVSRLVDCLDHYAQPPRSDDSESTGKLRHIRAGLEPSRVEGRPDIGYVEVQHHHTVKGSHRRDPFRFYEAYWAPVAAGGVQQWEVVKWMVGRILNPIRSVLAPWRLRARLRLSYLYSYWSRLQQQGRNPYGHRDLIRLVDAYHDFEGPQAWREYPDGRFNDFLRFLERRFGNDSPCLPLARAWRRDYRRREAFNQAVLVTLGLALALGALAIEPLQCISV